MVGWTARALPADRVLMGRFCRLEPLDAERHAQALYEAYASAPDGRDWTYLPAGPFAEARAYLQHAQSAARSADPKHYAVVDADRNAPVGTVALMRADPANGAIEVGWVAYSPRMQRKPAATEAQFLLMQYVFDELGYRRYEWKCDSLNAPSRQAAQRLGFTFEGLFRQATIYKQRSRDTAWFSIIDAEWPALKAAFQAWLAPDNFDAQGRQVQSLGALRQACERR